MHETIDEIKSRVKDAQRNYEHNLELIEGLLVAERHYAARQPINEDAVALCSGGMDSTVMIDMVIKDWNAKVHPLFIRRGARAEKFEEEAFDFFMDFFKKKFPDNLGEPAKIDYALPPKQFKEYFPKELALTVGHPLRNSTMVNLAVMYAVALNEKLGLDIRTVFSGSVGEDNTEPELGLLSLRAQTLNTCISLADWEWQIISPFTDPELVEPRAIHKIDLIRYASEQGIPLEKTRTCFSADEIADGTCLACRKRLDAFSHVKIKDPIKYKAHKEE